MPKDKDSSIVLDVVVITYNHVEFIRQALDSVIMQKADFRWRVLIADDCSTDGTSDIVREYASRFPDLISAHISPVNVGIALGRDAHFWTVIHKYSVARFLALIEGDDYWTDPKKLQKQVEYIEGHPEVSGVFHDTVRFEYGSDFVLRREYDRVDYTLEDTISIMPICHTASLLFRRENVEKLPRWFSRVSSGDLALYALVAANGGLHRLPMVMSAKRNHPGGISSTNLHRGIRLHSNRLYMHLCIRAELNGRCRRESNSVIAYHADGVFCGTWSVAESTRRIFRVYRLEPWLLLHPSSLFRLLQALIRIHFRKNTGNLC